MKGRHTTCCMRSRLCPYRTPRSSNRHFQGLKPLAKTSGPVGATISTIPRSTFVRNTTDSNWLTLHSPAASKFAEAKRWRTNVALGSPKQSEGDERRPGFADSLVSGRPEGPTWHSPAASKFAEAKRWRTNVALGSPKQSEGERTSPWVRREPLYPVALKGRPGIAQRQVNPRKQRRKATPPVDTTQPIDPGRGRSKLGLSDSAHECSGLAYLARHIFKTPNANNPSVIGAATSALKVSVQTNHFSYPCSLPTLAP